MAPDQWAQCSSETYPSFGSHQKALRGNNMIRKVEKLALAIVTLTFILLSGMSIVAVGGYEVAGDQIAAVTVLVASVTGLLSIVVLWNTVGSQSRRSGGL